MEKEGYSNIQEQKLSADVYKIDPETNEKTNLKNSFGPKRMKSLLSNNMELSIFKNLSSKIESIYEKKKMEIHENHSSHDDTSEMHTDSEGNSSIEEESESRESRESSENSSM